MKRELVERVTYPVTLPATAPFLLIVTESNVIPPRAPFSPDVQRSVHIRRCRTGESGSHG